MDGQILGRCPPALLKQFVRDGIVQMVGEPDEPIAGFEHTVSDALTDLSRTELLQMIRKNSWPIQPMKSWSDEQIRTTIREVADLGDLSTEEPA